MGSDCGRHLKSIPGLHCTYTHLRVHPASHMHTHTQAQTPTYSSIRKGKSNRVEIHENINSRYLWNLGKEIIFLYFHKCSVANKRYCCSPWRFYLNQDSSIITLAVSLCLRGRRGRRRREKEEKEELSCGCLCKRRCS